MHRMLLFRKAFYVRTGSLKFLNIKIKDAIASRSNKDIMIIIGRAPSIPARFIEIPFDKSAAVINTFP